MKCNECNQNIEIEHNFCPYCGTPLILKAKVSQGRITLPKSVRINLKLDEKSNALEYVILEINEDRKSYRLSREE